MVAVILVFSAFLPYLLWPVEQFLPYPYFIEEIAKGILSYYIAKAETTNKNKIFIAIGAGSLLAFSESVFYIYNILLVGNLHTYLLRLALTIPLHAATFAIITLAALKSKKFIVVGVLISMLIHFIFNHFVGML